MAGKKPLGILAGSGDFPWMVINHCRDIGRNFVVISFEDQIYDKPFTDMNHCRLPLGAAQKIIDFLKSAEVSEVILAGGIKRPNLRKLRTDKLGMKIIAKSLTRSLGDDGLLKIVSQQIESLTGAKIIGYEDLFGTIKWELGKLGKHVPEKSDLADMERAEEVFKCFAACDVGQSLIVQAGIVIGVEAIEGTQGLLERCKPLLRKDGRGFLFKKLKPSQFRKADLPTVGVDTIRQIKACGLQGLVIGQNGVIILNYDDFIADADKAGLFIYVVE